MVDRSFLPVARQEFVAIADTHYLPDPGPVALEFESRRRQAGRAERALRLTAALMPAFVVHLGDLAQAVPEGAGFDQAVAAAQAQLARHGVHPHQVAGNQDIGDKPDPTMPTNWVTPASLAAYHSRFGPSWYAWEAGDLYCIVVNSQIMNSSLPEAAEQQRWLEVELIAHGHRRVLLFMHLPLYLHDEHEPDLGHYDNLGQPARAWLLGLIRRYRIELVMTGHSHFAYYDRIGSTSFYVAASTSHTRPGFSELFAAGPPPEQGRDDTAKLGFYLVRDQAEGLRVHFLRTHGQHDQVAGTPTPGGQSSDQAAAASAGRCGAGAGAIVLTRLSPDLPHSPLGLTATHPLVTVAEVPLAWPSAVRQQVRNDYPWLASLELGARYLRVPSSDLENPLQRQRLTWLREAGIDLTASWLWQTGLDLLQATAPHQALIDTIELQMPGASLPSAAITAELTRLRATSRLSLTLAPLLPGQMVPGKQLRRTRLGYQPEELAGLKTALDQANLTVDRVLCRLPPTAAAWPIITATPGLGGRPIGTVDWLLDLASTDTDWPLRQATEALFGLAASPGSRLFIEPLIDLDRTMDISHGLLDRQCNPRPIFQALRVLNTALFSSPTIYWPMPSPDWPGLLARGLASPTTMCWLLQPASPAARVSLPFAALGAAQASAAHLARAALGGAQAPAPSGHQILLMTILDLVNATSQRVTFEPTQPGAAELPVERPLLVMLTTPTEEMHNT